MNAQPSSYSLLLLDSSEVAFLKATCESIIQQVSRDKSAVIRLRQVDLTEFDEDTRPEDITDTYVTDITRLPKGFDRSGTLIYPSRTGTTVRVDDIKFTLVPIFQLTLSKSMKSSGEPEGTVPSVYLPAGGEYDIRHICTEAHSASLTGQIDIQLFWEALSGDLISKAIPGFCLSGSRTRLGRAEDESGRIPLTLAVRIKREDLPP